MDFGVISVRYARALFKSALKLGIEDQVYGEAQALANSYLQAESLRTTVENPMLRREAKFKILALAAGGDSISDLMKNFIRLVLKEGREAVLQFMASSYIELYRKQKNIIRGKLITATSVTSEMEQKMKAMVEAKTHGTIEFETEVDPELIGGYILEYDTYRMDASVKTKLRGVLSQLKK